MKKALKLVKNQKDDIQINLISIYLKDLLLPISSIIRCSWRLELWMAKVFWF